MSTIGSLIETKPDEVFKGQLHTLDISLAFEIRPAKSTANPNAPSHVILAWGRSGTEVPVGAAWMKSLTKPGREGEKFLSLTFSDPSFGRPFNVAAFKSETAGEWNIVFRHRPEKAA